MADEWVRRNLVDVTGQRFGRLVVRGKHHKERGFSCVCDCGSVLTVDGTHLRTGKVQSCGCLAREQRRPWTAEEILIIRKMAGNATAEQIGKVIGRSRDAVKHKARKVGAVLRTRGGKCPWSKYSDGLAEFARCLHDDGMRPKDISDRLKVPYWAIHSIVYHKRAA